MKIILAGISHEVLALAKMLGYEIMACVDPNLRGTWHGYTVFMDDEQAISNGGFEGVIIAIDDPILRQNVQNLYLSSGVHVVSLEGGTQAVDAKCGVGFMSQEETVIGPQCHLGDGVRLNIGASIMAESVADDFATFGPRAIAMHKTKIGARSYIGANATLLPGTIIGADCIVGAGAVVSGYIPDGLTVKGNPAS